MRRTLVATAVVAIVVVGGLLSGLFAGGVLPIARSTSVAAHGGLVAVQVGPDEGPQMDFEQPGRPRCCLPVSLLSEVLPNRLPAPAQGWFCAASGWRAVISLRDGTDVVYGPCHARWDREFRAAVITVWNRNCAEAVGSPCAIGAQAGRFLTSVIPEKPGALERKPAGSASAA